MQWKCGTDSAFNVNSMTTMPSSINLFKHLKQMGFKFFSIFVCIFNWAVENWTDRDEQKMNAATSFLRKWKIRLEKRAITTCIYQQSFFVCFRSLKNDHFASVQCLHVNWIVESIPSMLSISLASVSLSVTSTKFYLKTFLFYCIKFRLRSQHQNEQKIIHFNSTVTKILRFNRMNVGGCESKIAKLKTKVTIFFSAVMPICCDLSWHSHLHMTQNLL